MVVAYSDIDYLGEPLYVGEFPNYELIIDYNQYYNYRHNEFYLYE